MADQSSMIPVDASTLPSQHAAAAVGMHVGYPAPAAMNDMNHAAMMMMPDVYHSNLPAVDQSAVSHLFHSVTDSVIFVIKLYRHKYK